MADEDEQWVALSTGSMALLMLGLLFLDSAAWYVQSGVLLVSLALAVAGALGALSESTETDTQ